MVQAFVTFKRCEKNKNEIKINLRGHNNGRAGNAYVTIVVSV